MLEENYNFKPTDTVRSFGQVVASQHAWFRCVVSEELHHLSGGRVGPAVVGLVPATAEEIVAALKPLPARNKIRRREAHKNRTLPLIAV